MNILRGRHVGSGTTTYLTLDLESGVNVNANDMLEMHLVDGTNLTSLTGYFTAEVLYQCEQQALLKVNTLDTYTNNNRKLDLQFFVPSNSDLAGRCKVHLTDTPAYALPFPFVPQPSKFKLYNNTIFISFEGHELGKLTREGEPVAVELVFRKSINGSMVVIPMITHAEQSGTYMHIDARFPVNMWPMKPLKKRLVALSSFPMSSCLHLSVVVDEINQEFEVPSYDAVFEIP